MELVGNGQNYSDSTGFAKEYVQKKGVSLFLPFKAESECCTLTTGLIVFDCIHSNEECS